MRGRRLLIDLSHPLRRGFPRATLLTRINVAALVEPRTRRVFPGLWCSPKTYALVAAAAAGLCQATLATPVGIAAERGQHHRRARFATRRRQRRGGAVPGPVEAPDTATLPNLATRMLALRTDFRLALARLPLPPRLLLVWLSLNIGRQGVELHGQLRDLRAGFARGGDPRRHPGLVELPELGRDRTGWRSGYPSLGRSLGDRWSAGSPRHPGAGVHAERPSAGRIAGAGQRELRLESPHSDQLGFPSGRREPATPCRVATSLARPARTWCARRPAALDQIDQDPRRSYQVSLTNGRTHGAFRHAA